MLTIEYRVTYKEGDEEVIQVTAKSINSGFTYALKAAKRYNRNTGKVEEISAVEFWQVIV